MTIKLFQFQQEAASQIADRFLEYNVDPCFFGRGSNRKPVPFYQALSSITGSGKTAILAQSVNEIIALSEVKPIVLWLSRGKVVVEQTYSNLGPGGKYNHLLPNMPVRLLSEYDPAEVEDSAGSLLYFATVGTFNQKDREKSNLKIFASDTDNIEATRWEALKNRADANGNSRPLVIVYDEAQNLSDQQTNLLLEQRPDVFLLASATLKFPAKFNSEVIMQLKTQGGYKDDGLITSIDSSVVVGSGLIKNKIVLAGINSPMQETISSMLGEMQKTEADAVAENLYFHPKAIYVCNTNVIADDSKMTDNPKQEFESRQAPPILIWRYLTENCGVPAEEIAVYADLKTDKDFPLPDDFILFKGGEKDYEEFTSTEYRHIIFNLSLQEGWDDPAVYFAYVDKTMDSSVQITQVIGRVLRQPEATHHQADSLNTASFYVRVDRNETFTQVVEDVRNGLGEGKSDLTIVAAPPGSEPPTTIDPKKICSAPRTAIDNRPTIEPVSKVINKVLDYSQDAINTKGIGRKRVVRQSIGTNEIQDTEWIDFSQSSQVSARWIFQREVSKKYKPALTIMATEDRKFDAKVGLGSNAYKNLVDVASEAVDIYLENAEIKQLKPKPYTFGSTLVRKDSMVEFDNAVHEGYDGLNSFELKFARELDKTGLTWVRNRSQSGYKIPLVSVGPTVWFFPDFLVWSGDKVLCIDTKGNHLIEGDARRKLLAINPHKDVSTRIKVHFVSEGTWKPDATLESKDGYSFWSLKSDRNMHITHYDSLESLVNGTVL